MSNLYPRLFEKFIEKSDPVRDMGIGAKPQDIFDQFLIDFSHEFQVEPFVDYIGGTYDVKTTEVYEIEGQYKEMKHPINTIISDENGNFGLIFVMSDNAATTILEKNAKWGFMYIMKGKHIPLKSLDMKGVIKEILKLRRFNEKTLESSIKKYEAYIYEVKKMKDILNES